VAHTCRATGFDAFIFAADDALLVYRHAPRSWPNAFGAAAISSARFISISPDCRRDAHLIVL